ncbi:MAG: NADH-quinone oxidoreductase subunit D, partial [Actinomycetota bacterium]|nr:NADH-quinone oxidoreductase subunit D [Actinomycetota bacterium]
MAVPLISAAILPGLGLIVPRRVVEAVSVGVASVVAMMCSLMLIASAREPIVYWFGGWVPRDRIVPGIGFVVDPLGAGTATLVSVLVALSLLFSWRYFDAVKALFHSLMLVFMAGMVGLCLTGDLFNLFVFFEIMSVCGFALAGYQTEERGSLVGALNFAITNTIGAVMVLSGIALLYGRTGALNLALLGRALGEGPPDGLVTVAFTLLAGGFLTKAAIVPFHFWLVDAYGTAVTPVCVIFAGVMSELGLFSLLRVYWTVFEGPLGPYAPELRAVLVVIGAVTAAVGGIMCLAQHHLSRLVAFAVVAHTGMFFVGIGLLDPASLGGAAIYVLTDGMVKAALFMGVGILFHRRQSLYDFRLHGRCRDLRNAGAIFALGGLALAGLPPFG